MRNFLGQWAFVIAWVAMFIDVPIDTLSQVMWLTVGAAYVGCIAWAVGAAVDVINAAIKRLEHHDPQ